MTRKQETKTANTLSNKEQALIDAYWRAANYLSVGQIYLYDNPLLKQPLSKEHIKPRLLGHWGTTPGLNFIYVHLNRLIKKHDLHHRSRARGSRVGRQRVPRRNLQRGLSEYLCRRRGHETPVHPILVPWRDPEPCGAGDARLDSRRRRTGLRTLACLWSRLRQPGSYRWLRRRRR